MTEIQVSSCCHARAYTKTTDQGEMQVCFHCFSPFQLAIPGAIPINQQGAKKFRARVRRERLGNIGCALIPVVIIASIFLPELRHWVIILALTAFGLLVLIAGWSSRDRSRGTSRQMLELLLGMALIGAIVYGVVTVVGYARAPGGESGLTCEQRVTQEWFNGELTDSEYNAKKASKCGVPNPILP